MTKSNIRYYFMMMILISAYGCQKDIIGEETESKEIIQGPSIFVESSVVGLVSDINGQPLANVEVEHRGVIFSTDLNGYFKFESASSQTNGGYLSFKKDNYFDNYKFYNPVEVGDQNFLRITMIEQSLSSQLSSTEGGEVLINGGAKINFNPNSFAKADGGAYAGNVNIYAHWYDPTSDNLGETMPGDLRGTDTGGNRVQLATYGMMGVELRDDAGNELNLAGGQTATLTFPIPSSLREGSPESIPTWSYDEERGYWREEGTASISGNEYTAEVSHFSFWNIDAKFPVVNFCVTIESEPGTGLPNLSVYIKIKSSGLTSSGMTNQRGEVCGDIPKDEELILYVLDDCNDAVHVEDIGPFSDDVDYGSIQINLSTQSLLTLEGQLTCNGMPVTDGYALLTTNDGVKYVIPTDANGVYSTELIFCTNLKVTVQGIDVEESGQAEPELFSQPTNPLVVNQEVCDEELEEFIIYNINDIPVIIDNPSAKFVNGRLTIYGSLAENNRIRMYFLNPTVSDDQPIDSLYAIATDQSNSEFVWCNNDTSTPCDDQGASFSEIGLSVGDYVIGRFESGVNPGKTLEGDFKIIIDEISNFNTIEVDFWKDDNEDGIQDSDESLWSFGAAGSGPQPEVNLLSFSALSVAEVDFGKYTYRDLEAGIYELQVKAAAGYEITTKIAGGNNIDPTTGLSDQITFSGSGETARIKVGFKPSAQVTCFHQVLEPASCMQEGLVAFEINNTDELTYNLFEDGTLLESESFADGIFELWLDADRNYSYQILDAQGLELCSDDFTLDAEEIICMFYPFAECDNGMPYVQTEWSCGNLGQDVTYQWSNGETTAVPVFDVPGIYSITVTDTNGCTATGEFEADFSEYLDINGLVWVDNPMFNDGIADPGDERYEGLVIRIYDSTGGLVDNTVSDAEGKYAFRDLAEGDYYIECDLPANHTYVETAPGALNQTVSAIDPLTNRSSIITIGNCNRNDKIGIGLKEQ